MLIYHTSNYTLILYIYSPEEVYSNLKKKGYNQVTSILHVDDKVFAVDQHCYDVLIFPSRFKKDLINTDLFKDYKVIFQVNYIYFHCNFQQSYLFKESPSIVFVFLMDYGGGL